MYKIFYTFLIIASSTLLGNLTTLERKLLREELSHLTTYQDIYFEGDVISKGRVCDCENRYELISSVCQQLTPGFTVLDLGAAQGYFSFRLAHEFNAIAHLVDNSPPNIDILTKLVAVNNNFGNDTTFHNETISLEYLKQKRESGLFDVVICTNIIHHIPGNKRDVLKAMSQLGHLVFLEVPTEGYTSVINYAEELGGVIIGKFFRRKENTLPTAMIVFTN